MRTILVALPLGLALLACGGGKTANDQPDPQTLAAQVQAMVEAAYGSLAVARNSVESGKMPNANMLTVLRDEIERWPSIWRSYDDLELGEGERLLMESALEASEEAILTAAAAALCLIEESKSGSYGTGGYRTDLIRGAVDLCADELRSAESSRQDADAAMDYLTSYWRD